MSDRFGLCLKNVPHSWINKVRDTEFYIWQALHLEKCKALKMKGHLETDTFFTRFYMYVYVREWPTHIVVKKIEVTPFDMYLALSEIIYFSEILICIKRANYNWRFYFIWVYIHILNGRAFIYFFNIWLFLVFIINEFLLYFFFEKKKDGKRKKPPSFFFLGLKK